MTAINHVRDSYYHCQYVNTSYDYRINKGFEGHWCHCLPK